MATISANNSRPLSEYVETPEGFRLWFQVYKNHPASMSINVTEDVAEWERVWQEYLDKLYPKDLLPMPDLLLGRAESLHALYAPEHEKTHEGHGQIRTKQLWVCEIVQNLGFPFVSARWKAVGSAARLCCYVHAMRAVCHDRHLGWPEYERKLCPDLTFRELEKGGGQGFLDLLTKLAAEGSADTYVYVPHPQVDSMLRIEPPYRTTSSLQDVFGDARSFVCKSDMQGRVNFLLQVVERMLALLHGIPILPLSTPTRGTMVARATKDDLDAMIRFTGDADMAERIYASMKEEEKKTRYTLAAVCAGCHKMDRELVPGTRENERRSQFKACAACKAVGKEVLYCSRECQRKHWKGAIGDEAHKLVCGTPVVRL